MVHSSNASIGCRLCQEGGPGDCLELNHFLTEVVGPQFLEQITGASQGLH